MKPFAGRRSDSPHGVRRGRLKLITQEESVECGLACLAMLGGYFGHDLDLASVRRVIGCSPRGSTLGALIDGAEQLGLRACALRVDVDYLKRLQQPCILHWNANHYIVYRPTRRGPMIYDPAVGKLTLSWTDVEIAFSGVCVCVEPNPNFKILHLRRRASLRDILPRVRGLRSTLAQLLVMTAAMEVLLLLLPLQVKLGLDELIPGKDYALLIHSSALLAAAVTLLLVLGVARGRLCNGVGIALSRQWTAHLFHHAVHLPASFYERRRLADLLSRFGSINNIQFALTGNMAEVVLDASTSVVVGIVMFTFQPQLAFIVFGARGLTIAIRLLLQPKVLRLSASLVSAEAKKNEEILESFAGIETIRIAGVENQRTARVTTAIERLAGYERSLQNFMTGYVSANQAIVNLERVLTTALGTWYAIHGQMTPGTLVAFLAYAELFSWKLQRVIDKGGELATLRVHMDRVAEIALEVPDVTKGTHQERDAALEASLRIENLSYRYGPDATWSFDNLNFCVDAGECLAVVGPSGCGKTTLVKLALGLLVPERGRVMLGGVDVRDLGFELYRKHVAAVMQDDFLFHGSILENIALGDLAPDLARVRYVSEIAALHAEVVAMPMEYETILGDDGASLSGGQKQRVLLARALYRSPQILILDEATSHLDVATERLVCERIRRLGVTCILIAHRPETIAYADRVIRLQSSQVLPARPTDTEAVA